MWIFSPFHPNWLYYKIDSIKIGGEAMIKKNKGYKFRLKSNKEQSIYLERDFGCSRKMWSYYR